VWGGVGGCGGGGGAVHEREMRGRWQSSEGVLGQKEKKGDGEGGKRIEPLGKKRALVAYLRQTPTAQKDRVSKQKT